MAARYWSRQLDAVELTDLVRYAGASGDFNPLHVDSEYARHQGYRTNLAHGMYGAGILGVALGELVGAERILRFGVRFVAPLWQGAVPSIHIAVHEDQNRAELELRGDGELVTTGWADLKQSEEGRRQ